MEKEILWLMLFSNRWAPTERQKEKQREKEKGEGHTDSVTYRNTS